MAQISVRPSEYQIANNLIGRSNVLVTRDKKELGTLSLQTNSAVYMALDALVQSKPMWTFKAEDGNSYSSSNVYVFSLFSIYEDDHKLGYIMVDYKGRDYKLRIHNDRISAKRERGDSYYTKDPKKAEMMMRKTFYKPLVPELVGKAKGNAYSVIASQYRAMENAKESARQSFLANAEKFVMAHVDKYIQEFDNQKKLDTYNHKVDCYTVAAEIQKKFDSHETTLVVLDGTHYVVATKEGSITLTDGELSFDMRRKLGMLKLVEPKQMISNAGCKIDNSTFVLLPESQEVKEQS